jgi:hypothetical protein
VAIEIVNHQHYAILKLSFLCNDLLKVETSFKYLLDYFKYSLPMKTKAINFDTILNDIRTYVFIGKNLSVDVRTLRNKISEMK